MSVILLKRILLLLSIIACCTAVWGAAPSLDPYIGYVYPAGGQQGTVFRVTVAGQRLRNTSGIRITGNGVRAKVIDYVGASGPLNRLQQEELRRRLLEIREKRGGKKPAGKARNAFDKPDQKAQKVTLPDLPELRNLEKMTADQLKRVADKFLNNAKRPKPPIAEQVTLEVTVDSDATPGGRELRVRTGAGLSNPLVFQVGQIPETRERGKDDDDAGSPSPVKPPAALNGQIMPGEVDRFPLELKGGQRLVIAAHARKLIPYLADAVPGWFQAVVAVRDEKGKEIAYADECGFDPDPALVFKVPRDGKYILEIRDSIYRGREDFVYRVDVGEESLIRSLFPMGSRGGVPVGSTGVSRAAYSNLAQVHFGTLPMLDEAEPNETGQKSMRIKLGHVVNGAVSLPGDKDVFAFEGKAGDFVVAEVYARRMGSPIDSLLQLIDTKGKVIASNDDHEDKGEGLLTHHADSYLSARLPAAGRYFVKLIDAQGHGGPEYVYSLRVGPPQPDFTLRVTPSALNVPAGRAVTATVYVLRKDGWDGDIDVLLKDAPEGFMLNGARIPKGRDRVRMTLTTPRKQFDGPVVLQMEGRAQISGKTITHSVVPADTMMQAFAYNHLVPSEQLLMTVPRSGLISPSLDLPDGERLQIPAGQTAQVSYTVRPWSPKAPVHLELSDPPAGVTLQDVKVTSSGFTLTLKADDKHVGYIDNLIVEVSAEVKGKGNAQKQKLPAGVLPAIPFEIVKQ